MCYSQTASFIASVFLIATGIMSVLFVRKKQMHNYVLLAMIPFLFGIQQFFEGLVWRGFDQSWEPDTILMYSRVFVFFAVFVWPFYIPLAYAQFEQNKVRKKSLAIYRLLCFLSGWNVMLTIS